MGATDDEALLPSTVAVAVSDRDGLSAIAQVWIHNTRVLKIREITKIAYIPVANKDVCE
jgi:hypothetical protein